MRHVHRLVIACVVPLGLLACDPISTDPTADCTLGVTGALPDPTGQADYVIDLGLAELDERVTAGFTLEPSSTAARVEAVAVGAPFAVETRWLDGGAVELRWSFLATEPGASATVATVRASCGRELTVRLKGEAFEPRLTCDPGTVDFGEVWWGQEVRREVRCHNTSTHPWTLVAGAIEGEDGDRFTVGPILPEPVRPGGSWRFEVTVLGGAAGRIAGTLGLASGGGHPVRPLPLAATVRAGGVGCAPGALDFGFVAPGTVARRELVCLNASAVPRAITSVTLDVSSHQGVFSWTPDDLPIVIPAAGDDLGRRVIEVTFSPRPEDAGTRIHGILVLGTDDASTPRLDVPLTGYSGGPMVSCSPAPLELGVTAVGLPATRSFTCRNTGTDDPSRFDDALIVTGLASTNPAEFRAEVRGGLLAQGYLVGEAFTVDVTYDPADEGADEAAVRILSNAVNAGGPGHAVAVSGVGRDLPPCELELTPAELRFGQVERYRAATLEFAIRNGRTDAECLIRDLRLADGCDPAFSLPAGEVPLAILPPGGELRVPVEFRPTAHRTSSCEVAFDLSDPAKPHQVVPVRASSLESCISVVPGELDFGTVRPGCGVRDRAIEVRSSCPGPVAISNIDFPEGPSAEFFGTSYPPAGAAVPPGHSVLFTVGYRPEDEGADLGAAHVYLEGMPEPFLVVLRGESGPDSSHTDVFESAGEACFPLYHAPEDTNGNGVISDAEGELTVRLNGAVTAALGPAGLPRWAYDPATLEVCFAPDAAPEPGTRVELAYHIACLSL